MRIFLPVTIAFLAFLAVPAEARVRDDVMAAMFRCGGIGDSHQWLDCYYGAAQPERAALGLPPVPASQMRLVAAPPVGGVIGDQPVRDAVLSSTVACDQLQGEHAWLDCYYDAARPMRAALGLPGGAAPHPLANAPMPALAGTGRDAVVARLTAYSFNRYGTFTVTLSNGQTWRQLSGDTTYAHWNKPPSRYTVTITHGAFGSFNLRVESGSGMFKVERVT